MRKDEIRRDKTRRDKTRRDKYGGRSWVVNCGISGGFVVTNGGNIEIIEVTALNQG